jgi:hypothetical protein
MLLLLMPWFNTITCFFAAPGGDVQPLAVSASGSPATTDEEPPSRGCVIEFYVPDTFQLPERRWIPAEERGKVIEFPTRGVRKSA